MKTDKHKERNILSGYGQDVILCDVFHFAG
jgi:hypothetical protein